MRRLVPDRLGARLALLLAAALTVALGLAIAALAVQRMLAEEQAGIDTAVARLGALVTELERVDADARAAILGRADGRARRLMLSDAPGFPARDDPRAIALSERLSGLVDGRPVRIGRGGPGEVRIALALRTRPEAWLLAELRGRPPRAAPDMLLPWLLLFLFAAVLGAGLLVSRQIARPLAALERAAQAAGRGDRTARAPETGPREARRAAAAFNAMQARLALAEADRARMIGALGHDLRTPITSLRLRAALLSDDDAAPMIATLDEMAVMAEGLLAFARGEAEPEDAEDVDLVVFLRDLATARGASACSLAGVTAHVRPVALRRAVGNLLDNALRYGGSARLTLARKNGEAVIGVEDDGPGIPEERLGDVQEPFVRGDVARGTGGAGLGLAIARTVAVSHGGRLVLANRPGGGLKAEIRLPSKAFRI